jgi:hypothetical protein
MLAVAFTAIFPVVGCGGSNDTHKLYAVSGNVTFGGKPVPVGFVTFEPNSLQGNAGPGCGASIQDGYYKTDKNKGIAGGSYLVTVNGSDGIATTIDGEDAPQGASLFPPYKTQFDFPKSDTAWDIEVPAGSTASSK